MRLLSSMFCRAGLLVFMVLGPTAAAFAQKALPPDRLTTGARVLIAFEPVIQAVRPSVVRVLMDDKPVALGLVVSTEGLIVSKASEIDPIRVITVQRGKEKLPARPVGWSETHDLVVLQATGSGWSVAPWSNGVDPAIGQFVITPGPEKLPLAVGVVSVARRGIEKDPNHHGVLGIKLADGPGEAVIDTVFDNSAAKTAGLKVGDAILKVGTVAVGSRRELIEAVAKHQPGETLTLEVRRDGKTLLLPATLTHPFGDFLSRIAQQNRLGGEVSRRASGFPAALQHDSVLKPEECGGPAVNIDGQVVGINIARSGRTESLLIPTSVVKEVLQSHKDRKLPPLTTSSPAVPPPPPEVVKPVK